MVTLSTIGSDLIANKAGFQGLIPALRLILRGFWLDNPGKRRLLRVLHHNVFF
jgi:hypothetical protein